MKKSWVALVLMIVAALSGIGILPGIWGVASNVVLQNLDKIPFDEVVDASLDANVIRIVDGDTIEVDLVPPGDKPEMLRLIGVDTPETVHPAMPVQFFGPESTQFTKNMCLGQSVRLYLQKDGPERGKYGRLLVYVELTGGKILNEEIISQGFGYSYTKYPHAKSADYGILQDEAQIAKRGLWAGVKFEDLPVWLRKSNPDILK